MEKKELKRKGKKNTAFHSDLTPIDVQRLNQYLIHEYEKHKVVWDLFQCNMNSKKIPPKKVTFDSKKPS